MNHFFAHTINAWALPGGVSCDDDDDQRRLVSFLQTFPRIEKALADSIVATGTAQAARAAPLSPATTLTSLAPVPAASPGATSDAEVEALVERALQRRLGFAQADALPREPAPVEATALTIPVPTPSAAARIVVSCPPGALSDGPPRHQPKQLPPHRWPKHPKRFSAAREAYLAYYNRTLKRQSKRTSGDKERLLELFIEFLNAKHAYLGEDPWVHDLDSSHVSEFLREHAERPGKRKDEKGNVLPVAPLTMLKALNDLRHFFSYQYRTAKSTTERVSDAWKTRLRRGPCRQNLRWRWRKGWRSVLSTPWAATHIGTF